MRPILLMEIKKAYKNKLFLLSMLTASLIALYAAVFSIIHRYYIHSENPCFFSTNLKISFDAVLLKTIKNEEKTTKIVTIYGIVSLLAIPSSECNPYQDSFFQQYLPVLYLAFCTI